MTESRLVLITLNLMAAAGDDRLEIQVLRGGQVIRLEATVRLLTSD